MNEPLQIYFVRHGETLWSLSGRHTGRTDLALTPHGAATAGALAATLKGITFSQVLTSPRLRARATCELAGLGGHFENGDSSAVTEPDLAEWDYGDYEGLRTEEIHEQRPGWDIWEAGCPGGESPADTSERADRLIARLCRVTGKIAVFSHGHFGRVLAARWIGLPVTQGQHFAIDPASLSILSVEGEPPNRRVISLWNATTQGGLGAA